MNSRLKQPKYARNKNILVIGGSYCNNMAKSGMNPKTPQYLMGHSDIGVTLNTYTPWAGGCNGGAETDGGARANKFALLGKFLQEGTPGERIGTL